MKQKIHTKLDDLITGVTQLSAGAATHAVSLGLVTATKPLIDADILALTNAKDALAQGRQDLRKMRTTLNTKITEGSKIALAVRDSLKRAFGNSYNPLWEGSPFQGSLIVPQSAGRLEEMLRSLKTFLTDNSGHEIEEVATAALAEAAANALGAARTAVQTKKSAVRGMCTTRLQKEKLVRRRIRLAVEELKSALGLIDARWEAFGLNQPGLDQTPPTPAKVTLTVLGGGKATAKWPKTARADYHRVWLKVIGTDEAAKLMGTAADLDFAFENVPSGQIDVSVSAVNNGGESQRSEPAMVTVT